MEWVETTGKTVEDAKDAALERLGVLEEDAEIDVLEEPKAGLFGRVRGEARVRARVRPTPVRQKVDRRDRRRGGKDGGEAAAESTSESSGSNSRGRGGRGQGRSGGNGGAKGSSSAQKPAAREGGSGDAPARPKRPAAPRPEKSSNEENQVSAEQVGQEAVGFMEGLVSAFGLTGTVSLVQDGDDLEVQVHGDELGLLVGPRGATLQAVQDLVRVAAQRRLGDHDTRLRVDVGGYRERRAAALSRFAMQMADEVRSSGTARILEPMSSSDRKIIHDVLSGVEGIATHSEGDDPNRRVVIAPAVSD
jgi:spoIIIJ-associated protein